MSSWSVLSAAETRESYLARRLEYYPARAGAERSDRNDRILLVGEAGATLEQDHLPTSAMGGQTASVVLAGRPLAIPADLAARLRSEGFSHMILVPREESRIAGYGHDGVLARGGLNGTACWAGQARRSFQARAAPCSRWSLPHDVRTSSFTSRLSPSPSS